MKIIVSNGLLSRTELSHLGCEPGHCGSHLEGDNWVARGLSKGFRGHLCIDSEGDSKAALNSPIAKNAQIVWAAAELYDQVQQVHKAQPNALVGVYDLPHAMNTNDGEDLAWDNAFSYPVLRSCHFMAPSLYLSYPADALYWIQHSLASANEFGASVFPFVMPLYASGSNNLGLIGAKRIDQHIRQIQSCKKSHCPHLDGIWLWMGCCDILRTWARRGPTTIAEEAEQQLCDELYHDTIADVGKVEKWARQLEIETITTIRSALQ